MPNKLKEFLAALSAAEANEIDEWLDAEPSAIDEMRGITFPLTTDGKNPSPSRCDK